MNIEQLQTFAAAADLLSFTRAGERRQLSQPAVSLQIRELETHFGVSLFERVGRQLALTPAGSRFRDYVGRILAETHAAEEELRNLGGRAGGTLCLGATDTIGNYLLPRMLGAFRLEAPSVRASLRIGTAAELARDVAEREIDGALLEQDLSPRNARGLEMVAFADDLLVLIVAAGHDWAGRAEIDPEDLLSVPVLTRQPGNPTRALIFQHLAAAGVDPGQLDVHLELAHTESLKQAVKAGLGVGFASGYAIEEDLSAGKISIVRIRGVNIRRRLWLAVPAGGFVPERLGSFRRFLLESPIPTEALPRLQ